MWLQGHEPLPSLIAHSASNSAPVSRPAPFHWSQLDAPDFPTFAKKLRAIGCPEATIRDIIKCELNEIYADKRQQAINDLSSSGSNSRPSLELRLEQLQAEETALFNLAMAGAVKARHPMDVQAQQGPASKNKLPPGSLANSETKAYGGTLIPVAFLAGNDPAQITATGELPPTPNDPRLNTSTVQILSQLRNDFALSLQDVTSNASTPEYRRRWITAQRASDEQLSSVLGGDYFISTQLEAARAAAAAARK